jgi:hypothetical protein
MNAGFPDGGIESIFPSLARAIYWNGDLIAQSSSPNRKIEEQKKRTIKSPSKTPTATKLQNNRTKSPGQLLSQERSSMGIEQINWNVEGEDNCSLYISRLHIEATSLDICDNIVEGAVAYCKVAAPKQNSRHGTANATLIFTERSAAGAYMA